MGAKQTKEDETPTSPKSPRVSPVDHASRGDETPVPALLDKLITETAPIASRLPKWMLPTNNKKSINKSITDALDEAKKDKSDDPNRINYLINRVDAAVRYGTQQTERSIGEMETRVAALEDSLAQVAATQQEIIDMLNRVLANPNA